jgi:iron complex transport system substrate-binding protein
MIMAAAGLENIAAEVEDTWTAMGWEAIVAANPDVIVLVDAAWNTADQKIAHLEQNPATAALPAVEQRRYLVVDFPATEAGVRNVDAVASLVEQLGALEG